MIDVLYAYMMVCYVLYAGCDDIIVLICFVLVFFFFQAEDGIRDLVRSRGLGDVYKRQVFTWPMVLQINSAILGMGDARHHLWILWHTREAPVSYTHLTLPTSDLV